MESTFAGKTVLVTGANRGLGQALVEEALRRGAKRVYAGTRQAFSYPDERVVPVVLDVTDETQIQAAVEQDLAVNLFGTWSVTRAFLPLLTRTHGAVVNVLSTAAAAALPIIPSYSVSKAASWSLSQSLRALLAPRGVSVHAVLAGPLDTEMSRELAVPKASTESVARAIFDAVQAGEDDIFPDPMSATLTESWYGGAVKEMERQNAALVAPEPLAA